MIIIVAMKLKFVRKYRRQEEEEEEEEDGDDEEDKRNRIDTNFWTLTHITSRTQCYRHAIITPTLALCFPSFRQQSPRISSLRPVALLF
jgi:hypothetical protein